MADVVLSRYRIERLLGHGGMGEVYAATDTRLGRTVALKFCKASADNPNARRQTEREARAASALNHPNIATVFDYEEDEQGRSFLVMEYVEGETLSERLARGPMSVTEALEVGRAVAAALEEAHHHGLLHRDIKPSNIRVTTKGVVKVLDFGLARMQHQNKAPDDTLTANIHGTPAYMSPEQAEGEELDCRSDLFALGAVLYECLTGVRVFGASTHTASLLRVVRHDPAPPSSVAEGIDPELDRLVMELLAKDREKRLDSARDVRRRLEAMLGVSPTTQRSSTRLGGSTVRRFRRSGKGRLLLGAALLAVVGATAWIWWGGRERANAELSVQARRWYDDGVAALRDGTYWRASKLLGEAVSAAPAYAPARARLAEAWLELDDVQRARQQILLAAPAGESLSHLPRADRLVVSAIHFAVTAEHRRSIEEYKARVDATDAGALAAALFDLARAYERAQLRSEAAAAFEASLREDQSMAAAHLRLGRLAARRSDFAKAESSFAAAEKLYQTSNNLEGVTEVLYQRAVMEVRRARYPEAEALVGKSLELSRATGNLQQSVAALLQRVSVAIGQGRIEEAQSVSEQAVQMARQSGAAILVTRAMIDVGSTFLARGRQKEAETYLLDALNSARANSDPRSEARAQANLGSLHQLRGQPREAIRYLEPSLRYYEQAGMQVETLQVRAITARTRRQLGDYEGAYSAFEKLRQEARSAETKDLEAIAEEGLASVRNAQQRYPEALQHYQAARQILESANAMPRTGFLTAAIANIFAHLGQSAQALKEAARAARLADERKDRRLMQNALLARASAELSAGKSAEALRTIEQTRKGPAGSPTPEELKEIDLFRLEALAQIGGSGFAQLCESMLASPAASGEAEDRPLIQLQCAIGWMRSGQAAKATQHARIAEPLFAQQGQVESLWMARAVVAAGEPASPAARRSAREALEGFERTLGPQELTTYRARPVVARLRNAVM